MKFIKIVGAFLLALLVASVAIAGVASATAFAEGPVWLRNGKKLEAGEKLTAEGRGTISFLVEGLSLTIECKSLTEKLTALGGAPGTDEDILEYTECKVTKPVEGCEVKEEKAVIESNTALVFLARNAAGEKWKVVTQREWENATERQFGDEFKAKKAGEVLGEVTVEGVGCAMTGVYKIKGSYTGVVNNGLEFTKESSNIKVSGPSGEFAGLATGFMEYFIVNGNGEPTGEAFEVAAEAKVATPALSICKKVPSGQKGLWNASNCEGAYAGTGAYAWSWAGSSTTTVYCVLGGSKYSDPLCDNEVGTPKAFGETTATEVPPKLLGLQLKSTLAGEVSLTKTEISCTDGQFTGQPTSATVEAKVKITYTGCTVAKPEHCEIGNPSEPAGTIQTKELSGRLVSLKLVEFAPESGTIFAEIEYKLPAGVDCVLHGKTVKFEGSQSCDWEPAAQTPAQDHLLNCKKTGSKLKFGGGSATYEGLTHIHLEGLPYWKIQ